MIKFTEKLGLLNLYERLYICTFCSFRNAFYELSPRKCPGCGKLLPDMQKLATSKHYRAQYHRGEE